MRPTIVILTGPTCAGKSTLEGMLKDRGFSALKSVTTREPRAGEVTGQTYDFVDRPTFDYLVANDALIEHVEFDGNLYGLAASEVEYASAIGQPAVVVVEPKGRDQIVKFAKTHNWNYLTVFVDNPREVIATRFIERLATDGMDNPATRARYSQRLASMLGQEATWRSEALCGRFNYDVLLSSFNAKNDAQIADGICRLVEFKSNLEKVA